jgi:sarcosine reductase
MKLEFNYVNITGLAEAHKTYVADGQLNVCKQEIIRLVKEDPNIEEVRVELVRPGESVRITPVKDVIEPRIKLDGNGGYFAGILSPVDSAGCGRTLVLKGAAVVLTGFFMDFCEGLIDMEGPGVSYSPFSSTYNVVLWIKTVSELNFTEYKKSMQMAGRKVAIYLAECAKDNPADDIKIYEWEPVTNNLPRVAHIHLISSRAPYDAHLFGTDVAGIVPTIISPLAAIDGATVDSACRAFCQRNTTYHHQNNAMVIEALERHLKEINLVGVIVSTERISHEDKEKNSTLATQIAHMLQLDGVVITEENAGNPDVDLMMVCRKAENLGIKTVLSCEEGAGRDGMTQSKADTTPEADAVISNGNNNAVIVLPPMKRLIGDWDAIGKIAGTFDNSILPDGSLEVEILCLVGATNELGHGCLSCVME